MKAREISIFTAQRGRINLCEFGLNSLSSRPKLRGRGQDISKRGVTGMNFCAPYMSWLKPLSTLCICGLVFTWGDGTNKKKN